MNESRRLFEIAVLGACGFILTGAILTLVLAPGDAPSEGNSLWRLILSISYLSVVAILIPYYRETLYIIRRNWFLAALLLLAFLSCFWAEMPALVFRRSIAVCGTTLFGIAFAVRLSLEEQLRLLSWLLRVIAVLSLACVVLLPSYGISSDMATREWQGVFGYKNVLGSMMAMSILVERHLPTPTRFSKTLNRLAVLLSAVLLFFSGSITPAVALGGSIVLIEIYKLASQRLRIPLYATVLTILVVILSGIMVLGVSSEAIASTVGRSSDLTGRTEIWSWTVSFIMERPILGYGYSGFWVGASEASAMVDRAMGGMIMYSHNGYLETLLTLGVVGMVLTLGFLGTAVKRTYSWAEREPSGVGLWPLSFLLFFLLHNLAESTILLQDLQWGICVAIVASTDPALFVLYEEQEDELVLEPSGEFT
jgi:exopolysaccharide production protein ExoQ